MDNDASDLAVPRDIAGKKKRINRYAKLKQCKLDANREQWLSQVKKKDTKSTSMAVSPTSPLHPPPRSSRIHPNNSDTHTREESGSDSDYATHSPPPRVCRLQEASRKWRLTKGNTRERNDPNVVDDDDGDHDWESVTDTPAVENEGNTRPTFFISGSGSSLQKPAPGWTASRAWGPNDASRPRSLPSLSKNSGSIFTSGSPHSSPSSCPICCEDLDVTDSHFFPCRCGFRICLFCHKRILEEDGRCPGCRKRYDPVPEFRLDCRTCSMP